MNGGKGPDKRPRMREARTAGTAEALAEAQELANVLQLSDFASRPRAPRRSAPEVELPVLDEASRNLLAAALVAVRLIALMRDPMGLQAVGAGAAAIALRRRAGRFTWLAPSARSQGQSASAGTGSGADPKSGRYRAGCAPARYARLAAGEGTGGPAGTRGGLPGCPGRYALPCLCERFTLLTLFGSIIPWRSDHSATRRRRPCSWACR